MQLLATCKRTHLRSAMIPYSSNTIHLQADSLEVAFSWSNNLEPEHRNLVIHISSITLGPEDHTAAALTKIKSSMPSDPRMKIARDWTMAALGCRVAI